MAVSTSMGVTMPSRMPFSTTSARCTRSRTNEGYSSAEIGKKLFLSPKTVDTYRARMMQKLGLTHRAELVKLALETGMLKPA
jgi:FixJ family two-component response regulator